MNSDDLLMRGALVEYIKNYQCAKCSDIGLCGHCAVFIALKLIEDAPAVPHEMTAREYLMVRTRMCYKYESCEGCPLNIINEKYNCLCFSVESQSQEEAVAIVEKWAKEHPEERSKE